jgi:hypothetical protein
MKFHGNLGAPFNVENMWRCLPLLFNRFPLSNSLCLLINATNAILTEPPSRIFCCRLNNLISKS